MKKTIKILILCVITFTITSTVFGESKVFQASLAPGIAIYDRNQEIEGFTLSLWGENPQTSLALGIINGTADDSAGVSLGFVNYGDKYAGIQLGAVNTDHKLHGLQMGFINFAGDTKTGFQLGFINIIKSNGVWFKNFPDEIAPVMLFINWRLAK
jgi:hypothetical protein